MSNHPSSQASTPTIKQRLYEELFPGRDNSVNKTYNVGMLTLIVLNVMAVILETELELFQRYKPYFEGFEVFSVLVFAVEYIVRLWVCTEEPKYRLPVRGRIRYALEPLTLIDLFSFLPFFLPFIGLDLRFIRSVRLIRLFRVLKMGRYSESLTTLSRVIKAKKEELVVTLYAGFILLIIASSFMYLVEHDAQPETFSSIPDAMWWGAVTLTTVGYGDVYPKTLLGKMLGALIAMLGIGLFALPAGIIASGFAAELQNKAKSIIKCPHCGKEIEENR
jgi:voltage-gated potassium channel